MTRILSYNILFGGKGRVNELAKMIASAQPDVVGLIEATNPQVVEELGQRLGMEYRMSGRGKHAKHYQVAVLSRLPIVGMEAYIRPSKLAKPLLEVCVEEASGEQLTVFVTHLTAAYNQLRAGDYIRRREVHEILNIMAPKHGMPHLLMGDFNALAPGDDLQASKLLSYLIDIDRRYRYSPASLSGHPDLNLVVPIYLRILKPLLRTIPGNRLLRSLFDTAVSWYAPRGSVGLFSKVGYVDCFRRMNPQAKGFTCPAEAPAGRIDYIFASPQLADRLSKCCVIRSSEGMPGEKASDHLPVFAEFAG
jgi:endonuclease/exonuclease/phosphatase family metal-dependent hydrolase